MGLGWWQADELNAIPSGYGTLRFQGGARPRSS